MLPIENRRSSQFECLAQPLGKLMKPLTQLAPQSRPDLRLGPSRDNPQAFFKRRQTPENQPRQQGRFPIALPDATATWIGVNFDSRALALS